MKTMSIDKTSSVAAAIGLAGFAVAGVTLAPDVQEGPLQWARGLSPEERQEWREKAPDIPYEYRRALLAASESASERSAFWMSIVSHLRATTRPLSPAQASTLNELEGLLVPANFRAVHAVGDEWTVRMAAVEARLRAAFGDQTASELMHRAGGAGSMAAFPIAERARNLWSRTSGHLAAWAHYVSVPLSAWNCNCTAGSGGDMRYYEQNSASPYSCTQGGGGGCGGWWNNYCDALCSYDS
jgi:hypothetical protein